MPRKPSNRKCLTCGKTGVKKNGTTTSGAIRWRCNNCGASWSNIRDDISHAALFDKFVNWLVNKQTLADLKIAYTTWVRKTEWCWRVERVIPVTGEIYDYIQIDGTYLPYGWCLLVAQTQGKVLAIQWCQRENAAAYKALLQQLPPPLLVLTDGNAGALRAISEVWPDTVVQRCLVHVKRNICVQTTRTPKLDAHKTLWGLAQNLVKITTLDQADEWIGQLQEFHNIYGKWLGEKTYRSEVLPDNVPTWVRPSQEWWYTYQNARKAYNLLATQTRKGTLFAFLNPSLQAQATSPLPSTTNALEGGINAQIKALIRSHRGLSEDHMRRAVEWWCYLHSGNPVTPHLLIKPEHLNPQAKPQTREPKPGPALWDVGIDLTQTDYHPDISIRKGTIR